MYSSFSFDFVCWFPWSRAELQGWPSPRLNQSSRSFSQSHVIVRTVPCRESWCSHHLFHAWPPTGIHCFVFYSKEGGEEISKINFFFLFLKKNNKPAVVCSSSCLFLSRLSYSGSVSSVTQCANQPTSFFILKRQQVASSHCCCSIFHVRFVSSFIHWYI
jgi:hypothetical protein